MQYTWYGLLSPQFFFFNTHAVWVLKREEFGHFPSVINAYTRPPLI